MDGHVVGPESGGGVCPLAYCTVFSHPRVGAGCRFTGLPLSVTPAAVSGYSHALPVVTVSFITVYEQLLQNNKHKFSLNYRTHKLN